MKHVRLMLAAGMLVLSMILIMACGSDKHRDARVLMTDQAKVTEEYINSLEKAQDADEVAAAINQYTDGLKEMVPRIRAFREKYPNFSAWASGGEAPEELQQEVERLNKATEKIQAATMKMMKYMMSPEVQEAMKNMGRELGALNP